VSWPTTPRQSFGKTIFLKQNRFKAQENRIPNLLVTEKLLCHNTLTAFGEIFLFGETSWSHRYRRFVPFSLKYNNSRPSNRFPTKSCICGKLLAPQSFISDKGDMKRTFGSIASCKADTLIAILTAILSNGTWFPLVKLL